MPHENKFTTPLIKQFYSLPNNIARAINSDYHINFINRYSLQHWILNLNSASKISYHIGKYCLHSFEKDDCETHFLKTEPLGNFICHMYEIFHRRICNL